MILLTASRLWAGDPRFGKDEVRGGFENAQRFMVGHGIGQCFRAQRESIASYNRRAADPILELLKKCE
jgi:hypothetical protein